MDDTMNESRPQTFLHALETMANDAPPEGMTLQAIFEHLDERAFGTSLFFLALPCAIPFLYLVPQIVSLPMMALSLQMLAGRNQPWLPDALGTRRINRAGLVRMSVFGRKWFGWMEIVAHPNLLWLTGKAGERIIACFLVVFCASILLPIPGTNTVPGIAVAITSFGLMLRDGRLTLLGLLLGSLWIAFLAVTVMFGLSTVAGMAGEVLNNK